MRVIKKCLDDFAKASGQLINLEKLKVFFSSNFNKEEAARIRNEAEIPMTGDLGRYLGTQQVHHRHGKAMYKQLMERYKRMDRWKSKCLSLVGELLWPPRSSRVCQFFGCRQP